MIYVKLNKISSIQYGKGLPTKKLTQTGYPVFGANGQIGFYTDYIFEDEQLMISCRGAYSGKINFSTKKCYITNNSLVVNFPIFNSELKKYYYFILQSTNKSKLVTGTAQPQVTINNANELEVPLPPLPEQRAIVAKIEQLFSALDNGIANLKKAKEQLKIYRQAVLKKAFEGDWEKVELEKISDAMGGYAFKSKSFLKTNGKYQVIRIGNVRSGIIRYDANPVYINEVDDKILNKYLLKINDVIISLTGTRKKRDYGFTTLIQKENLLLNQRLAYLRFSKDYLPKFFLYYSWSEPFKDQFFASETGNVGQGNVGMKSVRQTLVPLLPISDQHQIVQEIETRLSVCDNVEANIKEALKKAELLRQSILKKAFEGELLTEAELLKVRNDPEWEPAEKLLKRIKAEKAKTSKQKRKRR